MSGPVRTCVGCRGRRPQSELIRFAAVSGSLSQGRSLPGRGAYTCGTLTCFERAVNRRAFARTLRCPVAVRPELVSLYTEAVDG